MSAGTELEVTDAMSTDVARPVITPEQASEMVRTLRELISRILVKDKHYMALKGKDVLLKAGAEELGKFFALSSRYEDLIVERVEVEEGDSLVKVWSASVKCSVSNREGRILAESYGFYSGDERKKNGRIDRGQPANTIVKMAQKRAYVGAILTATGTSELFTQDIEDSAEAAPAAEPQAIQDRLVTDEEQRHLLDLFMRKGGKTAAEAKEWLDSHGAKAASANWCARQIANLMGRPDRPLPPDAGTPEDVVKTEPELPTTSATTATSATDTDAETVDAEVVDEEDTPF